MVTLTLRQANELIGAVLSAARAHNLPPIGVAVLDSGGHLKALQAEDGLTFLRVRICQAKAWGALALGVDTRELAERFEGQTLQRGFLGALNAMTDGQLIPLPGGVLVYDTSGLVIGAVGVAGAISDEDERCALAGIRAIGMSHP